MRSETEEGKYVGSKDGVCYLVKTGTDNCFTKVTVTRQEPITTFLLKDLKNGTFGFKIPLAQYANATEWDFNQGCLMGMYVESVDSNTNLMGFHYDVELGRKLR